MPLNYQIFFLYKLFCSRNRNMYIVTKDTKLIVALIIVALILTITVVDVSNGPSRVISAENILFKIKQDLPVEYDHVTIRGDLTLNDLGLPTKHVDRTSAEANLGLSENTTIVNSSIRVNDSIILGRAELSNSIFQKSVSFEGTTFQGSADFKGTQFNDSVDFKGVQFCGFVDLRESRFRGPVDLDGVKFNESVNFAGSIPPQFQRLVFVEMLV